MKISTKKLIAAKSRYDSEVGALEAKIKDKVGFDFSIFHQPSDGFVILNYEKSSNAPLSMCLSVIERTGFLSSDDHTKNSI